MIWLDIKKALTFRNIYSFMNDGISRCQALAAAFADKACLEDYIRRILKATGEVNKGRTVKVLWFNSQSRT